MDKRKPVKKKARERTQSEGPLKGERRSWRVIGFSINTSMTILRTSMPILRTSMTSWGPRLRFEDLDYDFEDLDDEWGPRLRFEDLDYDFEDLDDEWGPRWRFEDLDYDFEDLDDEWGPRWRFDDLDYDFEDLDDNLRASMAIWRSRLRLWGPRLILKMSKPGSPVQNPKAVNL
jgi:hypothetical protein